METHESLRHRSWSGRKAGTQQSVDAKSRGDTVPAIDVWAQFDKRVAALLEQRRN